jgi:hypothetical protein
MIGKYFIDGNDLYSTYGLIVENTSGISDIPKAKTVLSKSWEDESGTDYDVSARKVFEQKDIVLDCVINGATIKIIKDNLKAFIKMITAPGYRLLNSVPYGEIIPVLFSEAGTMARLTTIGSDTYLRFSLKFTAPFPEYMNGSVAVGTASVAWTNSKQWTIFFDNTMIEGTSPQTHVYAGSGTVVVAGTGVFSDTITKSSNIIWK